VLSWPRNEATDVPTNTSIVMDGFGATFAADPGASVDGGAAPRQLDEVALFGPDGELVPLQLARHLQSQAGCSSGPFIALPDRALEPNSEYVLSIGQAPTATFTTGDGPSADDAAAEALATLEWQTLGRSSTPSQISMMYLPRSASVPLFVSYQGSEATISALLSPNSDQPRSFSVGGLECVEVEVVDLRGATVHVEEVCGADRCVDSDVTVASSCGGNPSLYMDYAEFVNLPLGCGPSAAPDSPNAPDGPTTVPPADQEADAMDGVGSEKPETGRQGIADTDPQQGCAIRNSDRHGSGLLGWLALGLVGLALRRRN
jgi:hypothetical protein